MGILKDFKYTRIRTMLLSMALCAGAIACAPKTDPYAELKAMEEVFRKMVWEKGEGPEVAAQAQLLSDALVAFVSASPGHPESPVFLHNAASIDADFLNEPQRAATRFGQVADDYPDHDLAERCRFLQGFTLAESAGDLDGARAAYSVFLTQFPDSELAESVRYEIENLGNPLPDLP
jgi:TolA-binding protein